MSRLRLIVQTDMRIPVNLEFGCKKYLNCQIERYIDWKIDDHQDIDIDRISYADKSYLKLESGITKRIQHDDRKLMMSNFFLQLKQDWVSYVSYQCCPCM
jgi:hypothetical protein